jgi:hypothetical protein
VSPLHPAHTHAHTHTHTRARAHTRTRAPTPYPFSPSFSWFFFGRLCSPFSHACKATLLSSFHNLRCLAATPRCYAALRAFDDAGSLQLGEAVLPCQRRLTLCLSSPLYTGLAGALPCCIQAPHTRTRVAAHKSVTEANTIDYLKKNVGVWGRARSKLLARVLPAAPIQRHTPTLESQLTLQVFAIAKSHKA